MARQRYISKELTHFVGGNLSEEDDQYSVLVNDILNGRWFRHNPSSPQEPVEILESGGVTLSIAPDDPDIPPGELYRPQVVCFCDITLISLVAPFPGRVRATSIWAA
jgi:hypothetical protein